MIIPVIHTKSSILPKIIVFLALSSLILLVLILLSSGGMMITNYKVFNLVLVLILVSQFAFALYFLLARKYENLGKVIIENDSISVSIGKELMKYSLNKMVDTRIFLNHSQNAHRRGILGRDNYETGNFILFQYEGKTKIYELLLKNNTEVDELLQLIKNQLPAEQLRVFES